jgi:hypothetical protein
MAFAENCHVASDKIQPFIQAALRGSEGTFGVYSIVRHNPRRTTSPSFILSGDWLVTRKLTRNSTDDLEE